MDMKRFLKAQADRAGAVAALVVGALALLLGYRGVSDALYPGQQIPYVISGGLFGLFLVGVAAALWLSADLRDEWRKLDEVDTKLSELLEHARRSEAARSAGDFQHLEVVEVAEVAPSASNRANGRRRPVKVR